MELMKSELNKHQSITTSALLSAIVKKTLSDIDSYYFLYLVLIGKSLMISTTIEYQG